MKRKLAQSVFVDEILSISGADNLETARIGGWFCVVRKGTFRPGDLAVYLEIDSFLPKSDRRWTSFCERSTNNLDVDGRVVVGHRVKTVKVRKAISQGLLLSYSALNIRPQPAGTDLTKALGILKWEPPITGPAMKQGDRTSYFPTHLVPKTDAERVQNLPDEWLASLNPDDWIATEKIDGTSLTVIRASKTETLVCSRNYVIAEGDNTYWEAARKIHSDIPVGCAVQAEIFGQGIQGNPLNRPQKEVAIFLVSRISEAGPFRYLSEKHWPEALKHVAVPTYDLKLPATKYEIVTQADGIRSKLSPTWLAEGVVWRHKQGETYPALGGRSVFKVISNQYLLKQG